MGGISFSDTVMHSDSKYKLLIVAYYFPPVHSIGTLRNHTVTSHLAKYFSRVVAVVSSNRRFMSKDHFDLNTFETHESWTLDYRSIGRLIRGESIHYGEETKENVAGRLVTRAMNSFPFNVLLGEGGLIYIVNGILKGLRITRREGITHIYSSYRPYADHVIAYWIKRFKPQVYWIADFRDIHVNPVKRSVLWPAFQHWCNRRMLRLADVVTTVSQGCADHLQPYHANVYVLRNGVRMPTDESPLESFDKFTVAYTGSLHQENRDPDNLCAALRNLIDAGHVDAARIQVVYAGKDGTAFGKWIDKYRLADQYEDRGVVSFAESTRIQRRAHINLLLTYASNEVTGGLTGKLYEYLSACRPILLIIKGARDQEFEKVFAEVNAGDVFYHGKHLPDIERSLLKHYRQWDQTGDVECELDLDNVVKQYSWDGLIGGLAAQIGITPVGPPSNVGIEATSQDSS